MSFWFVYDLIREATERSFFFDVPRRARVTLFPCPLCWSFGVGVGIGIGVEFPLVLSIPTPTPTPKAPSPNGYETPWGEATSIRVEDCDHDEKILGSWTGFPVPN
jgi:hypothetical protein